jgi:hypothetical protein
MTSPEVSVIETIVLLNVLWMWATPLGTLRLAFLGPDFRFMRYRHAFHLAILALLCVVFCPLGLNLSIFPQMVS